MRGFPKKQGISQQDIDTVWDCHCAAYHPGIPRHMNSVIALVTAGVEMDV
jgi:hypothetical protein